MFDFVYLGIQIKLKLFVVLCLQIQTQIQFKIQIQTYMANPFAEKAISMVAVNENTGKYVVTEEAIKFLRAIQGPIAVVSVAGLYRTGKSYLLNRVLLNRSNGFGVGPTVNPCTKGLWCWGTPIKGISSDGEQVNIIVIDTQGIGALDEDQTHDTKIFTLAILASSCFIYNSVGSIDENAIQNLSLVTNLTKHIQLKADSHHDEDGQDPDEVATYFPSFFWVVRDFSLQLQDAQGNSINSKEYLERALAPQNGFTDDIEEKNQIRRHITTFFKDRDCFTMIRPLVDEQKLQLLDKLDYDQLRPEFVDQAMKFRKRIIQAIKVKTLQNQKLNGEMYCSMINSYVAAINEGAIPNIQNAWNYMCEQQCKKCLDDSYEVFMKQLKEGLRQFPKPEQDLNKLSVQVEETALDVFRQRALGDRAPVFLKELKNRIKEKLAEIRQENIKESNNDLKKYIRKMVDPLQKKLKEFQSFAEFQKQVKSIEQKLFKQGPKLHNYRYVYMQTVRKLSAQGADYLFKTFSKSMEKNKLCYQQKETQLMSEINTLKAESDMFRQKYNETRTEADKKISELTYQLETSNNQLMMTARSKEEEEKKMQRSFNMKQSELENNRKAVEQRFKDLMNRYEESSRQFNGQKKQWEKERALLDLKVKQQMTQIDQLQRREKALDSNLNVSKLQMNQQVREITQRHEREKDQIKHELNELKEKFNEITQELNNTKEEVQSKTDKFQKKQKKLKDDIAAKNRDIEKIKKQFQVEKKQLKEELQNTRDSVLKDFTETESKLRESQKLMKQLNEDMKKQKNTLQSEIMLSHQQIEFMKEEMENLRRNNVLLKETSEQMAANYEAAFSQQREESEMKRMTELKIEHTRQMDQIISKNQSERKRTQFEISNLTKKCQQFESQCQTAKKELSQLSLEMNNRVDQLNEEIKHLKAQLKSLESQKDSQLQAKDFMYQNRIRQLQNELEQVKDKSLNDRNDYKKESEESIAYIRNNFEIQIVNLEKRLANQKEKSAKKFKEMVQEYERKLEEETQPLQNELQDLRERYANLQDQFKITSSQMQHDIDINKNRADVAERTVVDTKDTLNRKQIEFNIKLDNFVSQSKAQKQKLETKIQTLISDNNKKDKDLMSITHHRDQLASTLEKRELKLVDLQNDLQNQKENLTTQIDNLHNKVSEMEKNHYDKITTHVKQNALMKQENEFCTNKIKELEKNLQISNQIYEDKINKYKVEKEAELKLTTDRLIVEKNAIESKYREFKTTMKDSEIQLKRQLTDTNKEKAILQEKIINLELRIKELQEKKVLQTAALQSQLAKVKESLNLIKKSTEIQIVHLREQSERLESDRNELTLKFQKQKSLSEQKIKFLENAKEENKRDYEERYKKLEMQYNNVVNSKVADKNAFDNIHQDSVRNAENKFQRKVQEMNEDFQKRSYEYESAVREKEQSLKELNEKYQTEKTVKDNLIATLEKKILELSEFDRRLKQENDKLKNDKEKREAEYRRRQKEEKDNFKNKMAILEGKLKESESAKMTYYFEYEKERSKWNYEKETFNEKISNYADSVSKLERDKQKLKSDVEKLKNERKNNSKTHTFVSGLKTYYEPMKQTGEEYNKENLSANE